MVVIARITGQVWQIVVSVLASETVYSTPADGNSAINEVTACEENPLSLAAIIISASDLKRTRVTARLYKRAVTENRFADFMRNAKSFVICS